VNEDALFDVPWLERREPLDHRSRARELLAPLRAWWKEKLRAWESRGRIVDLGSGTGANLRYLAPLLSGAQAWTLVDHDADLLARAESPGEPVTVDKLRKDLTEDLSELLNDVDLVTASAFLDLVSQEWLESLVEGCRRSGAAAYFALTYDGDFRWYGDESRQGGPGGPGDEPIRKAVNAHQRREKGFGLALGPEAAPEAARLFEEAFHEGPEYRTWIRPSPWLLGPGEGAVAGELLEGWTTAALEARPDMEEEIRTWTSHRRALLQEGSFGLMVGHLDVLALPRAPSDATGAES